MAAGGARAVAVGGKARHRIILYGYIAIFFFNYLVIFTSDPIRCLPLVGGHACAEAAGAADGNLTCVVPAGGAAAAALTGNFTLHGKGGAG